MIKLAYIEAGREHDRAIDHFSNISIDKITPCSLKSLNLMKYDILLIPSFINQDILSNATDRIKRFIHYGGIVIALGAAEDKTAWIPYCSYKRPFLRSIEFKNTDQKEAKTIFANLSLNEDSFQYHDKFITHGFFISDDNYTFPLITGGDPEGIVMAILTPVGATGKLLVTTVDTHGQARGTFSKYKLRLT